MDPDDYILKHGREALQHLIKEAFEPGVYLLTPALNDLTTGKLQALDTAMEKMAEITEKLRLDELSQENLLTIIANHTGHTPQAIKDRFLAIKDNLSKQQNINKAAAVLDKAMKMVSNGEFEKAKNIVDTKLPLSAIGDDIALPYFNYDKFMADAAKLNISVLKTGLDKLDAKAQICPGEFVVITARVRHGKSTLVYNIIMNASKIHPDKTFILFSHELPVHFIIARLTTIQAYKQHGTELNSKDDILLKLNERLADGTPSIPKIANEIIKELGKLGSEKRLMIIHEPEWNVSRIIELVRKVQADGCDVGGVFVDYLEMLPALDPTQSREQQVGQNAHQLRLMANQLNIPVICICQTNRECKAPTLEGLRYSGQIEQEASLVIGLFNENIEPEADIGDPDQNKKDVRVDIRILKNRNGEQGIIPARFFMRTGYLTTEDAIAITFQPCLSFKSC